MEKMIRYLYENTQFTIQQIADEIGTTYKVVGTRIKKWYPKEVRQSRKVENYRRSKVGSKNPMYRKFGEAHHNYKGVVGDAKGYLMVLKPDWYTGRSSSKHVFQHSVVMCKALGITEIPKGFVVHHVDGDRHNNDINNLALLKMGAHTKLHQLERATTRDLSRRVQEDSKRIVRVVPGHPSYCRCDKCQELQARNDIV